MPKLQTILQHTLHDEDKRLLVASSPISIMHVLALGALFTGISWAAVIALLIPYTAGALI